MPDWLWTLVAPTPPRRAALADRQGVYPRLTRRVSSAGAILGLVLFGLAILALFAGW